MQLEQAGVHGAGYHRACRSPRTHPGSLGAGKAHEAASLVNTFAEFKGGDVRTSELLWALPL